MKRVGLFAGIALAALATSARAHSLSDALAYAYSHSPLLDQQLYTVRAADEDVAIAVSGLRPTISFFANAVGRETGNSTSSLTTTLGLQLDWTLYNGGRNKTIVEARKVSVLAARHGLVSVEQNVLLNAVNAFMQLRQDLQTVSLRENNLRLVTQELRASEDRFDVGEITRTDVSIAQARLASGRSALAAARGQVEVSREAYKLAIGRYPHSLIAPPSPPQLPASVEAARRVALAQHPTIKQLQEQVRASELLARSTYESRRGTVTASGRVSTSNTSGTSSDTSQLTLQYSLPLYSGGQLAALSRQAEAQLNINRALLAQQGRVISDAVGSAWAQLMVARAQVAAGQQQVRAAKLAFDGTVEEANLGARTTLDVLNAEQELLNARTSALDAQTSAYVAVYGVLSAMGLLTTDHLGLSVERVDFDAYARVNHRAPVVGERFKPDLDRILGRVGGN